ncbi:hypothetical protein C8A03DRAFT_39295 [Achaetomium macrosporum]|uniref:Uncharacterized protein n=1 Tax=Achaetomium macrosporum TaxID=79813 RepID=A0AAN7C0H7_9PEZI|nr:hypothetical protein C8A03DRAFT_39295 [Achaetomium macrosporum]
MPLKTVLITGCSAGGIGSALAMAFHKRGFRVFATARDLAKMDHLADLANATLLPLDVTSRASIDAAVVAVKKDTGGTLDVLVNNAGMAYVTPGLDADVKYARDVFDVNFFGVVETTKAFAPLVIAGQGTIVNISSAATHVTMPWMSIYAASKAAMEQFSEGIRLELQQYNVRVITVVGGGVASNMTVRSGAAPVPLPEGSFFKFSQAEIERQKAGVSKVKGIPAEEFAEKVVADALSGAAGRVYRGFGATFVWVLTSLCPGFVRDKIAMRSRGDSFERAL